MGLHAAAEREVLTLFNKAGSNVVESAAMKRARAAGVVRPEVATPPCLRYDTALASGWPIATGVIEGACRHLVKDRMDITGARWGLHGAESVLQLRALVSNGDFDEYWHYHL